MKGKTELLTNFKFFSIPMVEMLHEEIQSVCNFSFLKIVKIEPANKVQSVRMIENDRVSLTNEWVRKVEKAVDGFRYFFVLL
jgi:hypothetical protein